jgi:hypothetical protein
MEASGQLHGSVSLPLGKSPLPNGQEAECAPYLIWTLRSKEISLLPAGIRTPAIQPVTPRYTDWVIRTLLYICVHFNILVISNWSYYSRDLSSFPANRPFPPCAFCPLTNTALSHDNSLIHHFHSALNRRVIWRNTFGADKLSLIAHSIFFPNRIKIFKSRIYFPPNFIGGTW